MRMESLHFDTSAQRASEPERAAGHIDGRAEREHRATPATGAAH
jgi:hypothetical protein